jgi:hypothetical protein
MRLNVFHVHFDILSMCILTVPTIPIKLSWFRRTIMFCCIWPIGYHCFLLLKQQHKDFKVPARTNNYIDALL